MKLFGHDLSTGKLGLDFDFLFEAKSGAWG